MNLFGLITFSNVILILSILMIFFSLIWLFGIYFVVIVNSIPLVVIEVLMYIGFSYGIYMCPQISHELGYIWGLCFTSCLTVASIITFQRVNSTNLSLLVSLNIILYSITGIYIQSTLICAVSVMLFMYLIGLQNIFSTSYIINHVLLGHNDQNIIPRIALSSGITTIIGCICRIFSANIPVSSNKLLQTINLFVPGMLWFGPFLFLISLLITSSSFYSAKSSYMNYNLLTIFSAIFALLIGNLYNIHQLSGISGTIFVLYLLEKYIEIMPQNVNVLAWSTLAIGITLYTINIFYRSEIEKYGLYQYFHFVHPLN